MTHRLDPERWSAVRLLFDEIVELSGPLQARRLQEIGESDPELRSIVEDMLASDREVEPRLARVDQALRPPGALDTPGRVLDPLQLTGRDVAHFRVVEPIASGGMGVVYSAEDTRLHRRVALKFPLPERQFDPEAKERFLQEARSAGSLDHPNLCSIYDIGQTDRGYLFLAMPLYDGETLKTRLQREKQLSVGDAVAIAQEVARGLSAAHKAGIVHRDLKPANVMLLRDGGVKILDFGLAKVRDLSLTSTQARIGTVGYMAPEQIRGGTLDGRTDLWALGVVLFEMLMGRRPFEGDHDVSVAHAILHDQPRIAAAPNVHVPAALNAMVDKLLQKDPAKRYQTASELLEALSVLPTGATHPTHARQWQKARPLRWSRARTIGLVVTLLLAVAAGAWRLRRRATAADAGPQTVAVWPFESKADDDIALGFSDDITDQLGQIARLNVTGRWALAGLRPDSAANSQVELGARAFLTGDLRRAGDAIEISARLTDPAGDQDLWTKTYTVAGGDLAQVRGQLTSAIAKALRVELSDVERSRLERVPTRNAAAYALYLRGRTFEARADARESVDETVEELRGAQSAYWRALELDPSFALARARLAITHGWLNAYRSEDQARRELTRLEAENALRTDPQLGDAHMALANYWRAQQEPAKALAEFQKALQVYPNNAQLHMSVGSLYRNLGRWEDAISEYERAMQLNPRDPGPTRAAAMTYSRLRRYPEAIAAWDRAHKLLPRDYIGQVIRGHVYLRWQGSADTLAATVKRLPRDWDENGVRSFTAFTVARVQRKPEQALAALNAARVEVFQDDMFYYPRALLRGRTYLDAADTAQARKHFQSALTFLSDSVRAHPRDARMRVALGLAYAGLGRKDDAQREARAALELAPVDRNSPGATAVMAEVAAIYSSVGNADAALELLELLFAMPAGREVSVGFLNADPTWDPLRKDPRFARMLERFSVN